MDSFDGWDQYTWPDARLIALERRTIEDYPDFKAKYLPYDPAAVKIPKIDVSWDGFLVHSGLLPRFPFDSSIRIGVMKQGIKIPKKSFSRPDDWVYKESLTLSFMWRPWNGEVTAYLTVDRAWGEAWWDVGQLTRVAPRVTQTTDVTAFLDHIELELPHYGLAISPNIKLIGGSVRQYANSML